MAVNAFMQQAAPWKLDNQFAQNFQESREAETRNALVNQEMELKKTTKTLEMVSNLASVATPENWPQIKAYAEQMFPGSAGKLPDRVDQNWINMTRQATMSAQERLYQQYPGLRIKSVAIDDSGDMWGYDPYSGSQVAIGKGGGVMSAPPYSTPSSKIQDEPTPRPKRRTPDGMSETLPGPPSGKPVTPAEMGQLAQQYADIGGARAVKEARMALENEGRVPSLAMMLEALTAAEEQRPMRQAAPVSPEMMQAIRDIAMLKQPVDKTMGNPVTRDMDMGDIETALGMAIFGNDGDVLTALHESFPGHAEDIMRRYHSLMASEMKEAEATEVDLPLSGKPETVEIVPPKSASMTQEQIWGTAHNRRNPDPAIFVGSDGTIDRESFYGENAPPKKVKEIEGRVKELAKERKAQFQQAQASSIDLDQYVDAGGRVDWAKVNKLNPDIRKRVMDAIKGMAKQRTPKKGMRITTGPDGTTVVETGVTAGSGLQRSTRTDVEKNLLQAAGIVSQLTGISKSMAADYQKYGAKAQYLMMEQKDKLGSLTPQERQIYQDMIDYKSSVGQFSSEMLRALSGAAVTDGEYERARQWLPVPGAGLFDGDSPEQMSRKVKNLIEFYEKARARWTYIKNNGLSIEDVPLDKMPALMERRFEELAGEILKTNPGMDPAALEKAVNERISAEFGLEAP